MRKFNLKVLLLLSLGHLVTDIYQGALPAILPFLKDRLSLSYAMTGVILMVANFTSSIIQPLFGYFSDKQEKPLLLPIGCLCAGIGLSLMSIPLSYTFVLILVVISGLGIASYHPEGYKTAHFFTGEKRVTGMAIFSVGGNFGFALGPIIAMYVITYLGFASLPIMILPALLFTAIILFFWRKIAIPADHPAKAAQAELHYTRPKGTYLSLVLIIAFVMIRSWMQMGLVSYIPFYYINYLQGDPLYAGKLVFTLLFGSVFGTLGGAPLADKWGHKRYLIISMALATLAAPLMLIAEGALLFAILGLLGMIVGSTFTVTIVMAQQLMPRNLGIASGMMVGFAIGAGGVCVTLLGVVADYYGVPFALKVVTFIPVIGLILSLALRYPVPEKKAA